MRINQGMKAIHARKPRSAGGKERHRDMTVRKESPDIFIKSALCKVFMKINKSISLGN
jgi:hypothetical protein